MGDIIVIAVLALVVGLVIYSIWRSHKQGGGCCGDCSKCKSCPHE
ncbi:MAG: FeoB-associated Cys-rich membrane protein [Ruminococcaceae bacterium]|nr:FeoB-associated Cys-rich membrane protein [Oscillospiraceae bacterium]